MKTTTRARVIAATTCLLIPLLCHAQLSPPLVSPSPATQRISEPFGSAAPDDNPSGLGSCTFNLRFPGQCADAQSGPFYNYFRSHDPSRGSYTQSDPIGLAGGSLSTYSYVAGNPLSDIDPNGLKQTFLTPFVLPGAIIQPGNPGAPGGYGQDDPRAFFPCKGAWAYGQCIPLSGPTSTPSKVIPFPRRTLAKSPANSCDKKDDPCAETWYKLMEWKDILDAHQSVDPTSMKTGDFLTRARFEQLFLRRAFNTLAEEFNRHCVPLGWAPITTRYHVGPIGPPIPGYRDLGDFYGR